MPSDLRGLYGTGGTTLSAIGTLLTTDGASVAGMPLKGDAVNGTPTMIVWGIQNLIADTHRELQMLSADQFDARNGEYDILGASAVINDKSYFTRIPFKGGVRTPSIRSNTAAGKPLVYMIDNYPMGSYPTTRCGLVNAYQQKVNQTLSAATAQTAWVATGVAPTTPLKAAKYAILGATINAVTDHAVIRYSHADFNGYKPGFPISDTTNTLGDAANNAQLASMPRNLFDFWAGYQFVMMDQYAGTGCPVFQASSAASGLSIEIADTAADTANVTTYLAVVG